MKNYTVNLCSKVKINCNKEQIFKAATDWEGQRHWVFLTNVRSLKDTPNTVGKKLQAFTGIGSRGFMDTMDITLWDPPYKCVVLHTGNLIKGSGIFEVTTIHNDNYFVWTEQTELPLGIIGRVGWLIVKPFVQASLYVSLRRFVRYANAYTGIQ